MPRIEVYISTTMIDEDGDVFSMDDSVMCFVEDNLDHEEVHINTNYVMTTHCESLEEQGFDVRYCTGIVYVGKKPVMSISYTNSDLEENVVPLHSPDWERLH